MPAAPDVSFHRSAVVNRRSTKTSWGNQDCSLMKCFSMSSINVMEAASSGQHIYFFHMEQRQHMQRRTDNTHARIDKHCDQSLQDRRYASALSEGSRSG